MKRKKPINNNENFNQFMNIFMYNKHIEETFFYKFEDDDLKDIKNDEPTLNKILELVIDKMPYSFGFEMYFYDDIGYFLFKDMLNKAIGLETNDEDEEIIDVNEIESHFCFTFPKDKNIMMVFGDEYFEEIDENLHKDKKEVILVVTIYKPSAIESLDEFLMEHENKEQTKVKSKSTKRKSLEELEKELQDALKIEDYENCAKIQIKIDKIKNKPTKNPSKK